MGPQNRTTAKAKNVKFASLQFAHSIKPYRWPIFLSVILAVGSAVLGLFVPNCLAI